MRSVRRGGIAAYALAGIVHSNRRFEKGEAENEGLSERDVDRRANLRSLLAGFNQTASKLDTDSQSGPPDEAALAPCAAIFGEKQTEMVRQVLSTREDNTRAQLREISDGAFYGRYVFIRDQPSGAL